MTLIVDQRVRHHTAEQIQEAVLEALRIARDAELSDADRQLLLPGILGLCVAVHLQLQETSLLTSSRGIA